MSSFAKTILFLSLALVFNPGQSQALTLGQAAQVALTATPAAFNTVELTASSEAQSRVPQWNHVRSALHHDVAVLQNCLQSAANCNGTAMTGWRQLVLDNQDQDDVTKLQATNQFFNQWSYVSDQENYGVSEYWASPLEFMQKGGDCEDYAIAKYVTLKFLGYSDRQMRIMAVIDNSRGGIGHAVLSVATAGGKMILDNQSPNVYNDAQQVAYAPRFAVNETGIYTYAQQPQMLVASAE